jgi:hypothetical protein
MKDCHGEHIFCELPDQTICSLPAWMFNPRCVELSLGSPLIAVDALAELRDLLTALQVSSSRDKASLKSSLKEGTGETNNEAIHPTIEPGITQRVVDHDSRQQAAGVDKSSSRAVDRGGARQHGTGKGRRRP